MKKLRCIFCGSTDLAIFKTGTLCNSCGEDLGVFGRKQLKNTQKPLKGKRVWYRDMIPAYTEDDIKSAVAGLIKFHEDRIEELIKEWTNLPFEWIDGDGWSDWVCSSDGWDREQEIIKYIQQEYESIMAIEHWLGM
jgi:septin family protein